MEPKVVTVLLNWNGRQDTLECLASLARQAYGNLEVVVVDQGSRDGLVDILKETHPDVALIENSHNVGFARGNNQGIQYAVTREAAYVFLLNNDTVVDEQCVRRLVYAAAGVPHAATLGPKIYYYDDPRRIWSAGCRVNFTENVTEMEGYGRIDTGQFERQAEVDFVSGCAVMVPVEPLATVGLLSEEFSPAYYEDADWGMRFKAHGYVNVIEPAAKVWHKVSSSTGGDYNPTMKYLMGRHAVLFMKKHARWHNWVKWSFMAVLSLPFLYLFRLLQGKGRPVRAKAAGIRDGLVEYVWGRKG